MPERQPSEQQPVAVVGLVGGEWFGTGAERAITGADVVIGAPRHLGAIPPDTRGERIELKGPFAAVLDLVEAHASARQVCVLASGDPGFFGIVRTLSRRVPVTVYPAPSSVALAFARIGVSWDDATVVSAHGRPLAEAVAAIRRAWAAGITKVAVLTSPDSPPQAVGAALAQQSPPQATVMSTVASRLGDDGESLTRTDLRGLAKGAFDPLSVVILETVAAAADPAADHGPGLGWGLPESAYVHRAGLITKAEVRAVALAKLALPPAGVLWDVGAGSGSVAIEAARLSPGLAVYAVERNEDDAARIRANVAQHGVAVEIVIGDAPDALAGLPDPDRVFVGGGGLDVLDAALARLRPAGLVVANYTMADRAVQAWRRLGQMAQVSVSRAAPIADGVRLAAENPVFIAWGPAGP